MGAAALSVLRATTRSTSDSIAASITFCAPRTFVFTNSKGLYSAAGTCLSAAAWMTTSTPSKARMRRGLSRTSPRKNRIRRSWNSGSWPISYCLSSSRDRTTIRFTAGSIVSSRRMKALPNEPVPPVTTTDLPARLPVGCWGESGKVYAPSKAGSYYQPLGRSASAEGSVRWPRGGSFGSRAKQMVPRAPSKVCRTADDSAWRARGSSRFIHTPHEEFWAGSFGDDYVDRNRDARLLGSKLVMFERILRRAPGGGSALELGANIGLNLEAIHLLLPEAALAGIEINAQAHAEMAKLSYVDARLGSLLEAELPEGGWDLTFTAGVLIHIHPDALAKAYDQLYRASRRYVLVAEYYNRSPVTIRYRDHAERLFKRDFAGEILDRFPALRLVDYGFQYHRDPVFPADDLTWFLLEKTSSGGA